MGTPKIVWKTSVEIVTDYDPGATELGVLAREATDGSALCTRMDCKELPFDEVATEVGDFFGNDEEDEYEDDSDD